MKTTTRILIMIAAGAGWIPAFAQQAKNPVQLGDQYFAAGEYYTAAHLYGQYLNPSKKQKSVSDFPLNIKARRSGTSSNSVSRTDVVYRQAESYRLANYWTEAAASYKAASETDPAAYNEAIYWMGVCDRNLGNYASAMQHLQQYLSAADASSVHKADAQKELETLRFIQQQLGRPDSILFKVVKVDAPNSSEKGIFAPVQSGVNQFLISSTQMDTVQVNGVNPFHSRLYSATMNGGVLESMTPLAIAADPNSNQGASTLSPNGIHLYFSQWKKENGKTSSAIYHSVKEGNGWTIPTLLEGINLNGFNSKQPFCSADGKYIYFSSDRPGGSGSFDIWYAPINNDGSTGEVVNAGAMVNTTGDEQAPFYQNSSSTLVFASNGKTGMGGFDLYAAKGNETTWKKVENLGYPVNSSRDDIYFYAPEKSSLLGNALVSTDRGSGCCLETYKITKAPKSNRISGIIIDCIDNAPVEGAEVILKDGSGKTWTITSGADGRYVFETGTSSIQDMRITINKEKYLGATSSLKIAGTDETDLLTDQLNSVDLCIEKMPEEEPEPVLVIKAEDVVTVYFDFDKSILKADVVAKLDSIYNVMIEVPVATIQISGYTDGLGTAEYNAKLSDRRARACADYLVKKGIEASRISFVSFGACCPVEMELINGRDNPDGRSLNRRALINVKKDR